jgi:hypothetical protein
MRIYASDIIKEFIEKKWVEFFLTQHGKLLDNWLAHT